MMTGKQLKDKLKEAGIRQEDAARQLGITVRTLQNWFQCDPLDANMMVNIKNNLEIDIDYYTNEPGDASTGKLVPLYDADAAAGQDYVVSMEPARPIGMIDVGGLLRDSDSALRVYGNSMIPNYPAGCIVGLKFYTERFIEPGYVYVVETSENRYLKRLYYNDDKTAYHCLSDNHMCYEDGPRKGRLFYPDFEIPLEDVRKVFRVVGVIKRNIL